MTSGSRDLTNPNVDRNRPLDAPTSSLAPPSCIHAQLDRPDPLPPGLRKPAPTNPPRPVTNLASPSASRDPAPNPTSNPKIPRSRKPKPAPDTNSPTTARASSRVTDFFKCAVRANRPMGTLRAVCRTDRPLHWTSTILASN